MELIIFSGLQAAGKTSFYRRYFAATHELVSKDLLRNNKRPGRRQAQLIETALSQGRSVVVDNTNPTREERAELIRLGRTWGAEIIGYYFETPVKEALERNKQREGRARIPNVGIFATAKKLVPPSYAEGFDRLYRVRIAENDGFDISEWENNKQGCYKIENKTEQ